MKAAPGRRVTFLVGGVIHCQRVMPRNIPIEVPVRTLRQQQRASLKREGWTLRFIPRPTGGGDWYYHPPGGEGPRLRSLAEVQRWKTAVRPSEPPPATVAPPQLKILLQRCPLCGAFSTPEQIMYHIVAC